MKKTGTILIILAFIFLGCNSKDRVKPSADSLIASEAIDKINAIKTAYEEKDRNTLPKNLSVRPWEDIVQQLSFESAELSFVPRMVRITASSVMVHMNWHGEWVIDGKGIKNRGISVFVLEGEPLKLMRVEGDNPFQIPLKSF